MNRGGYGDTAKNELRMSDSHFFRDLNVLLFTCLPKGRFWSINPPFPFFNSSHLICRLAVVFEPHLSTCHIYRLVLVHVHW